MIDDMFEIWWDI